MAALHSNRGFSLLELMVSLVVASILMAGIYAAYITQLRAHMTQQLTVEMQQNLRAAMQIMAREIRMAGYNPTTTAGSGITTMFANSFGFTADLNGNGTTNVAGVDTNENVRYAINANGDLGRDTGGGLQPVAEFIDALNFVYLDEDGNITSDPTDVRSVQVTFVGRSSRIIPALFNRQTDTQTYRNQQGQVLLPAPNDLFRRMIITSDIKCRNLG
jgi:type IV pilus assembly protein PilW